MKDNTYLAGSIIRLLVPLIVGGAALMGYTLDADMVLNVLATIAGVGAAVYCWWWRNNPITAAAKQGQELIDGIKEIAKEEQE